MPHSSDDYALGLLTAQYLLGLRGDQLGGERLKKTEYTARHLGGLQSTDRASRARWLARGLRDLGTALDERRWDAA
ncbi:MAG: hypothetical protein RJA70_4 [Pseudomonadota bacterium]|jgi:hypothetical protein